MRRRSAGGHVGGGECTDAVGIGAHHQMQVVGHDGVGQDIDGKGAGCLAAVTVNGAANPLPRWLRLTRSGNTVTAWESTDGLAWMQTGAAVSLAPPSTSVVGLVVNGGSAGRLSIVTADELLVAPAGGG
jgi:hypothetical protein